MPGIPSSPRAFLRLRPSSFFPLRAALGAPWGRLDLLTKGRPLATARSWVNSSLGSWLTVAGAALAVAMVLFVTQRTLGAQGTPCIVASMGASAVILHGMPETTAARMWPLFGGHLLSASAGVLATQNLTDPTLIAALSVGGALFLMSFFRCMHPPGGATALTVAMGGAELRSLGFGFLVAPLLLNLLVLALTTHTLRSFKRAAQTERMAARQGTWPSRWMK